MKLKTSTKLAVASAVCRVLMWARRLVGRDSRVAVTRDGIHWHLDLTEGVDLAIYLFGRFESSTVDVFRRLIVPGAVVLDIGANIGANTLELARCVGPSGRVIAFEPADDTVSRLRENLEANPELAARVTVEHGFLGDGSEQVGKNLAFYSSWPLATSKAVPGDLHRRHGGQLQSASGAVAHRLDDYLAHARIAEIGLIKLDVDGHECAVLDGGTETLQRRRPPIVMEFAPYVLDEQEGAFEAILATLEQARYALVSIPGGRELSLSADSLRAQIPNGASINVLATPRTEET